MLDDSIASEERHDRFVKRVVASGEVWGLKSNEGWVISSSTEDETEDREIMPFWSESAYARQCATEDWAGNKPTAIPLAQFLENWLPGMADDQCLVGTNWNVQMTGHEIDPLDLLREIEEEMERAR